MPNFVRSVSIAILAGVLLLAGARLEAASAAEKITFVTDFGFNGRHSYFFVALDKGYYKAEGLDVDIVRGQGSADAVKQVAAGSAQIGFADAAAVILARGNDHIPVQLVSMIYAKPPHAIYTLEGSGITKPKDLEGRQIADTAFSAIPKLFDAYAKAAGIDAAKVTWLVASSDSLPGMLSLKRADGIGQYTVGEALLTQAVAPRHLVRLAYADVGLDFYSNGIIASESLIKTKPEVVRAFVRATLHGLRDAMQNPQEAAQILHKYHREVDVGIGVAETKAVAGLASVPGQPLGSIEAGKLGKTIDIVAGAYKLKTPVTVESLYAPGFVPQ